MAIFRPAREVADIRPHRTVVQIRGAVPVTGPGVDDSPPVVVPSEIQEWVCPEKVPGHRGRLRPADDDTITSRQFGTVRIDRKGSSCQGELGKRLFHNDSSRLVVGVQVRPLTSVLDSEPSRYPDCHWPNAEERPFGPGSRGAYLAYPPLGDTEPVGDIGVARAALVGLLDRSLSEPCKLGGTLLVPGHQLGRTQPTLDRVRIVPNLIELVSSRHDHELRAGPPHD